MKVLIANRGEIATRIASACGELRIPSVAVYSTADADSMVTRIADEVIHIGPPAASKSYNNIPAIIGAALKTGANAIHPGYGFLSEDPYFAEICNDHDITFIGPPPQVIERMADKAACRHLMKQAGLPILPGTTEPVTSPEEAKRVADEIGYPLIIKAAAGGGGRGMTVVRRAEELTSRYRETRAQALTAFKDSSIYLERYLPTTRHIEIQIMCDSHGNAIHLGERDCSIQRRHQKLLEEAPSMWLTPELRERMGDHAVRAALHLGYVGAGTMEFLVDDNENFWLMEVNTRIQVEHPVSELITGFDLVAEQIRVAQGEPLSRAQGDIALNGHAIECRVNAEDPDREFAPTTGLLETYTPPGGPWTRVDSHCYPGWAVGPFYDSLLAKLIVWGEQREQAIDRMLRALRDFSIESPSVRTTIPFHQEVLTHPVFRSGEFHTDFVGRHLRTA